MNPGTRTITLLLTAPPYLFGAVFSFLVAYSSDHFSERGYHISAPMVVAIVGFVISAPYFFPSSHGPRYVMAMLLMMTFSVLSIVAALLMKYLLKKANKDLLEEAKQTGQQPKLYTQ